PVALGVFIIVLFTTIKQRPVFRAIGSLEVDMPKQAITGVTGLFQDQAASENYLQMQTEILHSRAMVVQLMKKITPVEAIDTPHGDFGPASIDAVVHGLSVEVMHGSRLIQITDESNSPDTAAQVVNLLMALYIEKAGEQRTESAQNASSWLLNQVNETRSKLEQATRTLQRFEQDHELLFVSSKDGIPQSIENERLEQLQAELNRVQQVRITRESLHKRAEAG